MEMEKSVLCLKNVFISNQYSFRRVTIRIQWNKKYPNYWKTYFPVDLKVYSHGGTLSTAVILLDDCPSQNSFWNTFEIPFSFSSLPRTISSTWRMKVEVVATWSLQKTTSLLTLQFALSYPLKHVAFLSINKTPFQIIIQTFARI